MVTILIKKLILPIAIFVGFFSGGSSHWPTFIKKREKITDKTFQTSDNVPESLSPC